MSGKNSKAISVSFWVNEGVVGHNNRDVIAKNVDKERIGNNITYRQQDIREKYNEIFSKALDEYNSRQKRNDRKIADYYEHIRNSKQEKPFYVIVVQFGDMESLRFHSNSVYADCLL